MTPRLFVLTVAAAIAVAGSAGAAGYSSTKSDTAQHSTAAATKAAPAPLGDNLTQKDVNAAIPLSKVSNPVNTLASAKVDDRQGNSIGPVKSVITGKSGAATAIHVDVDGHTVSMTARNFTYVKDRNLLLTRMSKAQVEKLPAVKG